MPPAGGRPLLWALTLLPALQAMALEREIVRIDPGTPELRWQAIGDAVMGGVSRGEARVTSAGALLFTGEVSLENNGGFASIRSLPLPHALAGAAALRLEVKGDGKRYKLNLRTDAGFDGVQYQAAFDAPAGGWQTVTLPLAAFRPTFRGRPQPQAAPLDPARVVTLGLMIADRQAGPFALEVRSITALGP